MPMESKAQRRLMYATLKGAKTGVSKATAKKYVEHDKGGKKLPERKGKKR